MVLIKSIKTKNYKEKKWNIPIFHMFFWEGGGNSNFQKKKNKKNKVYIKIEKTIKMLNSHYFRFIYFTP